MKLLPILLEAKTTQSYKAVWKPLAKKGRVQTEPRHQCPTCGFNDYVPSHQGLFPILRFISPNKHLGNRWNVDLRLLVNPKEDIVVDVVSSETTHGKRVSKVKIISGGDQHVSYWTDNPGYRKQLSRHNPNGSVVYDDDEDGEFRHTLNDWSDNGILYVMTKDLKKR